jgi:hypothetical protein
MIEVLLTRTSARQRVSGRHRMRLFLEHDLFRKPVPTPDQVRGGFFGIML